MNKYKVAVYAISKNEEKFVDRWMDTMNEADAVYVLDTGSTDNTVDKLKSRGAYVTVQEFDHWRFDVARNASLDLVPDDVDICVCTDLDEILEPGWRAKVERLWHNGTTRLRYNYNWMLDDDGVPLVNFYIEKIHTRDGYTWTHPVHEVLKYEGSENFVTTDEITVNHYPDKEKSRSSYLPLLELSVKESPNDDRNVHYLGREYMYYGKWNEAIDALTYHLSLESATWKDERCASMRFIARCYRNLKRYDEAELWLDKAIEEAPYLRDPFVERAMLAFDMGKWQEVITFGYKALSIREHPKSYINEVFSFDGTVYDLMAIAKYNLGLYEEGLFDLDIALRFKPDDERLLKNKQLFLEKIKN